MIHTCTAFLSGVHSLVTRREPLVHAIDAKLIVWNAYTC